MLVYYNVSIRNPPLCIFQHGLWFWCSFSCLPQTLIWPLKIVLLSLDNQKKKILAHFTNHLHFSTEVFLFFFQISGLSSSSSLLTKCLNYKCEVKCFWLLGSYFLHMRLNEIQWLRMTGRHIIPNFAPRWWQDCKHREGFITIWVQSWKARANFHNQ